MPLFVLSPASLAHSALFTGYYTYLSANVIVNRFRHKKPVGISNEDDGLSRAQRAHGNFLEYTPFTFLLLFLAELNGAPTAWVHSAFAVLFVARVAHCSFGIYKGILPFRKYGFLTTVAVMVGTALYNFSLGYEPLVAFLTGQ
ncbi:hypothetical protein MCUN1_002820 [Malassezia cuniculi]|uniref:Uncharacterized protein n=1 Tax=Malassezia cuniculi TaxID=948313 RepID=A0AAF0EVK6_9BASI|nr:hypothetical protein MCUN1_002820 [Malassezia cuniculi]